MKTASNNSNESVRSVKLTHFMNWCKDLDARDKLFSDSKSQKLIDSLAVNDFPIRHLTSCPAFDVRTSLLEYKYEYVKRGKRDNRLLTVSSEKQLQFLEQVLEKVVKPSSEKLYNDLYVIAGVTDFQKARFLAGLIAFFSVAANAKKGQKDFQYRNPLWHTVKGGFDDILRDSEDYRLTKGNCELLILDGLTLNSSKLKLEKFNDILNLYSATQKPIDIIVLAAGLDPLAVASQVLNTTFEAGLFLDEGLIVSME
jgi:hypothetical protein